MKDNEKWLEFIRRLTEMRDIIGPEAYERIIAEAIAGRADTDAINRNTATLQVEYPSLFACPDAVKTASRIFRNMKKTGLSNLEMGREAAERALDEMGIFPSIGSTGSPFLIAGATPIERWAMWSSLEDNPRDG